MQRFLTTHDEELLQAERALLLTLRDPLAYLEAARDDVALLDRALLQLDELFLLVVVGEFNAGKSAFINALLGARLLPEGVTPTTTQIQMIKYGDNAGQSRSESGILISTYPAEWLREINLVDTPGTNAVIQRHQEITEEFVPRADLILFVTSADRPFSESERIFLQRIREWGKKVVVVINKVDILEMPGDVDHITGFVEENARDLLGRRPTIFPVSARQARQAKQTIDADERTRMWAASRFEPLEDYILQTLDERERLRLKLASPLGVAGRLADRYLAVVETRKALLRDDVATVQTIELQLEAYEADMRRDFKYRLSHIENVLYAMGERGNRFFDETIRLARVVDLVRPNRVRALFEQEVVADTAAQIDTQTQELIDWMVSQDYKQWQAVTEYVNRRAVHHEDEIVGRVGAGGFEYNRQELLRSVGRSAHQVVASYNQGAEAAAFAQSVQMAVAQTAVIEVGALSLGALLIKLLAATMADITGLLAAGVIAAFGLYVIPYKRRQAKRDLESKISELREQLSKVLGEQFEAELAKSLGHVRDAMRPYTRFVGIQQGKLAEMEGALRASQETAAALAREVGAM
jgi:small GTP-binding protein